MSDVALPRASHRLPAYALYGAVLSGAGLPIYIYAPKFFADTYGVSLAALGVVLFGLRLFDVVQDPVLGWLSERLGRFRAPSLAAGAVLLAASMVAMFAVAPPIPPLIWFAVTITGLFTAFSFLSINFYAQGVAKAAGLPGGHLQVAAWRESGALSGVCAAAVAPALLVGVSDAPYAVFAFGFAALALLAAFAMAPEWRRADTDQPLGLRAILRDALARRLLILALVNAAPLAVSSTLFLFFVESRLEAPGWEGPLLVLFFLAAAASSPAWAWAASRHGAKPVLMGAMTLAIPAFGGVLMLGPGDVALFALICVVSGATIGADLTLMPALFARRMATIAPSAAQGFGVWSLVSKLTLAIAAAVLLPVLDAAGFEAGVGASAAALLMLSLLYALLPCILKLIAIAVLAATPIPEG